MAHLTQSFWLAVAKPILVANQIWAHLAKPWEPSINPMLFFLIAHHLKKNDDSPFTSVKFFCFWGYSSFNPMFFGAPAVEVVLELRKYCFGAIFDAWHLTSYSLMIHYSFFESILGKSKKKRKSTREPQLSENSRSTRKRAKQDVVHRMAVTSIERKTNKHCVP